MWFLIQVLISVKLCQSWWRHQMGSISVSLALIAGNSSVSGEFPSQRSVTRSFDVFYDLRLNKRLSKQSWRWWLETPSCSLWRHCNGNKSSCRNYSLLAVWAMAIAEGLYTRDVRTSMPEPSRFIRDIDTGSRVDQYNFLERRIKGSWRNKITILLNWIISYSTHLPWVDPFLKCLLYSPVGETLSLSHHQVKR